MPKRRRQNQQVVAVAVDVVELVGLAVRARLRRRAEFRHAFLGRDAGIGEVAEEAQRLIGKHDFTTFRSTECQAKSPVKTLDRLDVIRAADEVHIKTSARSFLHNQVRSMVGSLALVGDGKWSADDLTAALAARDRAACAPVAPPDGLYLESVSYAPLE